jgi:hypothetical protein
MGNVEVTMTRTQLIEKLREMQRLRQLTVRDFAEVIGVTDIWLYRVYAGKEKPGKKILSFMGLEERKIRSEVYVPKKREKVLDSNQEIAL